MKYAVILILSTLLSSCASYHSGYNAIGRYELGHLKVEGIILGFEKMNNDQNDFTKLSFNQHFTGHRANNMDVADSRNENFLNVTNDPKKMTLTHIVQFGDTTEYIYNSYSDGYQGNFDYAKGIGELLNLEEYLVEKFNKASQEGTPYSHILLLSMGWNNDQFQTISHYNSILNNLNALNDEDFNPFVIGVTWPSTWFSRNKSGIVRTLGHGLSYFNKANDADELGYTYLNILVNRVLPNVRQRVDAHSKYIAIGHSFGGRILSRAIYSENYLIASSEGPKLDAFIGLMPAYSVRRYTNEGHNAARYVNWESIETQNIIVSSYNDKANPYAFWTTHIGGGGGIDFAKRKSDIFDVVVWNDENIQANRENIQLNEERIVVIDASSVVFKHVDDNDNDNTITAHNDIDDVEMAEILNLVMSKVF